MSPALTGGFFTTWDVPHSLLCQNNFPLCVYIYIFYVYFSLSIHLPLDMVCFYILAIVNDAAVNMGMHIFVLISVIYFLQINSQEWNCWIIW